MGASRPVQERGCLALTLNAASSMPSLRVRGAVVTAPDFRIVGMQIRPAPAIRQTVLLNLFRFQIPKRNKASLLRSPQQLGNQRRKR
jgi:hypothetical protein